MVRRSAVRAVPVPEGSLAAGTFTGVDYADAYAVVLPRGLGARAFAEAVFASSPRWVAGLMAVRNIIVRPLGLIATRSTLEHAARTANGTGASIGIFPILAEAPDEIVLGLDDRHLDFRISTRVLHDGREPLGVVTSLVRFHGLLGRAYFVPVRTAHRLIVPAILRGALRDVERRASGFAARRT